jgi:hypothetical protein
LANTLQGVHVAAGSDYYHIGVGGAAGVGGTAGVGVGLQIAIVKHDTKAEIGASAAVKAKADVNVLAANADRIVSIAVGFGGGGFVGVGGSVAVNTFDNKTYASIASNAVV